MAKVTYHAPRGDSEVVYIRDIRFIDGEAIDVDNPALVAKLRNNPHFEVEPEAAKTGEAKQVGLRAVHRGRGVYGVFDGDVALDQLGPMTKDDADAFNSLSAEDKAAFVSRPAEQQSGQQQ